MSENTKGNLKPIPQLPVLREDICPKSSVDAVMDELIQNNSYDLEKMSWYLLGSGTGMYMELAYIMWDVIDTIGEKYAFPKCREYEAQEFVEAHLFYSYLACEIIRRMQKAYGYSDEYPILGKPLAPTPQGPFPPLVACDVSPSTLQAGFSQELIDTILKEYYKSYPKWWYIRAETIRMGIVPYFNKPAGLEEYLHSLLPKGFTTPKLASIPQGYPSLVLGEIYRSVDHELYSRVQMMCEIK